MKFETLHSRLKSEMGLKALLSIFPRNTWISQFACGFFHSICGIYVYVIVALRFHLKKSEFSKPDLCLQGTLVFPFIDKLQNV